MKLREQLEIKYSAKFMYDFSEITTNQLTTNITYTCIEHDEVVRTTGKEALDNYVVCDKCKSNYTVAQYDTINQLYNTSLASNVTIVYDNNLHLLIECNECGNKLKLNKENRVPVCRTCSKSGYTDKKSRILDSLKTYSKYSVDTVHIASRKVNFTCNTHGATTCTIAHWNSDNIPCSKCAKELAMKPLEAYKDDYKDRLWTPRALQPPLIIFDCPIHGEVAGLPSTDIPCRKCKSNKQRVDTDFNTWKAKAIDRHNSKFDYSNVEFLGTTVPIRIFCNRHQSFFWYSPSNHILTTSGGCPDCQFKTCGFNQRKPAILYYLRLINGTYKIGVTNNSVTERYPSYDRALFTVIKEWKYTYGADALAEEQRILKEFKQQAYTGEPILTSVGITAIFNGDILQLDN